MKGILRFGKKGKLSPRFISPFEILEKIGNVAYQLALPPELSTVHNVFHISMLRKYIPDPNHVMNVQSLNVQSDMTYEEAPAMTLERKDYVLRNRKVPLVKVQWSKHGENEATWEREDDILAKYPDLLKTRFLLKWGHEIDWELSETASTVSPVQQILGADGKSTWIVKSLQMMS
ncbi:uncharacterized protein LOC111400550 [Olea europaea var. sylvestris]|uniref:uncharacterized protein LOC111400550 n=1 Tax=Olea europaea var. sylvestris TaxID=158386 RepID=UPI000C1D177A|nr:uncharacterized protein LOC111400550 [Olea europaea var. sylvestris]